jgi:putative ABC transport system ATP-binding protein
MIEIHGLVHHYGVQDTSTLALRGVDLRIPAQKVVALVGRSGSGKSTLLNLIGGLDRPSSGRIRVCGSELTALTRAQLDQFRARNIGFIFQDFGLIPDMTVQENVAFPLGVLGEFLGMASRVREVLDDVGMGDKYRRFPYELSGGQQQRVAIARALIARCPLILADEPTANLDNENATSVMQCLLRCKDLYKSTVLIATHDPRVRDLADFEIEINDGRITDA